MDRYVLREPRVGGEYPQGNQIIAFSPNTGNNNMIPTENMAYYGGYGAELPMHRVSNSGFMGVTHGNAPQFAPANIVPGHGEGVSGIDPRYLATYAENNAAFIAGQQRQLYQQQRENYNLANTSAFDTDYQNRNFVGANRKKSVTFAQQQISEALPERKEDTHKIMYSAQESSKVKTQQHQQDFLYKTTNAPPQLATTSVDLSKSDFQSSAKTRADKLKALQRSGPRAFSGPVEKVLKWHKMLQDIGMLVLYEIVAKCVNVRAGESCAKCLVIRDDSGPAMQVVYYEIDFLLPDLRPPCSVRVIGRMMPGTCRLQAFNVRLASGDDVATLPRRAAVAAHHVAKLCKEYGAKVV